MHTPRDRWTAVLRDFEDYCRSASRFNACRGLSPSTFDRTRKRCGDRCAPVFIEASPSDSASGAALLLTVEFLCSRRISMPDGFDDLTLANATLLLQRIDRLAQLSGSAS